MGKIDCQFEFKDLNSIKDALENNIRRKKIQYHSASTYIQTFMSKDIKYETKLVKYIDEKIAEIKKQEENIYKNGSDSEIFGFIKDSKENIDKVLKQLG